ncbi:type II toxin-antitoxin system HicB family antitoxin [Methanogenium sp. S4BF]|uniref:type II toxin-antitoxin system HicB family antitoxin n=1 Tax=Methanogenium sp. S4BF TaxID=1789226 RepID=UPI002417573A|nr:type II toxin-antitoxin system HicB family antitoxin [Methanogenium sp. S4BF]WFN33447.1 type II toxin-antitoxin system HicB family antitoxin [Methanogenium sp. S4BF]
MSGCQELEGAGCGDSPQDALDTIQEAIELYLENARALGIIKDPEPSIPSRHTFTSIVEGEG